MNSYKTVIQKLHNQLRKVSLRRGSLTDRRSMCDLTVRAVIQVDLSCFVLLYPNTATQMLDKEGAEGKAEWTVTSPIPSMNTHKNADCRYHRHMILKTQCTIRWKKRDILPSMKPVLTDVTLDHEACHIVRQTTQAVHRHRCHIQCVWTRAVNVKRLKANPHKQEQ